MARSTIHNDEGRPGGAGIRRWWAELRHILWGDRFDVDAPPPTPRPLPYYVRYRVRRRSLPNSFTTEDWNRALDYWGDACAICGRPRGLWHTISQDHWIPLTDPDCPGTVPTNMLPMCYGTDGCNNSKGPKKPELWLADKLGKRKAKKKLEEIRAYFQWVAGMTGETVEMLPCPDCAYQLEYTPEDGLWHCYYCGADWRERQNE